MFSFLAKARPPYSVPAIRMCLCIVQSEKSSTTPSVVWHSPCTIRSRSRDAAENPERKINQPVHAALGHRPFSDSVHGSVLRSRHARIELGLEEARTVAGRDRWLP
ncbi:hypothetical protein QE152_g6609 [Popillia japonica]|uniref:Secreted protein n=1 Tax=Popillia japonica TaxID=7064 RepID=A0AAW1MHS7_POPJA